MSPSLSALVVVLNVALIAAAAALIYGHLHQRALQTAELRSQKQRLEREVAERTRELAELSTHLQSVSEREKAGLARELHDELGGLLVGARMDISWAEQHLGPGDVDLRQRLNRVQQNLVRGHRSEAPHHRGAAAHAPRQRGFHRGASLAAQGVVRASGTRVQRILPRRGAEVERGRSRSRCSASPRSLSRTSSSSGRQRLWM